MRRVFAVVAVAVIVSVATGSEALSDETTERSVTERMWAIADGLSCPVCQGQSVRESNAALAQEMRKLIRTRIASGDSDRNIYSFFAARYGPEILRDPPKSGALLAAWIAPIAALVIGLFIVLRSLSRRRQTSASDNLPDLEPYQRMVDELYERDPTKHNAP